MALLTREHINEIMKLYKHLPDELDETLNIEMSILKGHICIEERLKEFIELKLPNPRNFFSEIGRVSFNFLLSLARSLDSDEKVWGLISQLNKVRNRVAHGLDNDKNALLLREFLSSCSNEYFNGENITANSAVTSIYCRLVWKIKEITNESS